ncbi:MAG: family 43 glycosylhydrolase [Candidatus Sumerlaeia bacterium]|nr:family 43 glycosylhydrolase [Candidatus Sumerlaeia bacterium]
MARPLLVGNWADPTVLKDGNDYYMTHSSFQFHPGLLIWHSKDLRRWKPVAHAVVNQKGSIWAPDLIKHDGRYYIYYPAAGTNWGVTADSIAGPWSKPVSLEVGHIDPGHVVGPDGRRYLHLSGGHAVALSANGLATQGRPFKVYDGWTIPPDWAIECFCLESPKLTQRGGWYYLTSAQGGTAGPATSHMVVSARSLQPLGPWENSPHNPIIRTWGRDEPWWSKGHGTLVEGTDGQWYCVLHGYMNGFRTLGRCTLIEPIQWTKDGWFHAADRWPSGWEQPVRADMPASDEFAGKQLGIQWQFYERYDPERFRLADGRLLLNGFGDTPGRSQPLTIMAMHRAYEIETDVVIEGDGLAGLMLFGSPELYIGLAVGSDGKLRRVQEGFRRYPRTDEPTLGATRVTLRIVNEHQDARFYYRLSDGDWVLLQPNMELALAAATGPYTLRPALFATGQARAAFECFRYRPLESDENRDRWLEAMFRLSQNSK